MRPAISTHVFLPERLETRLLDALRAGGAEAIELFAARYHFDYTDPSATREIARWFRGTGTEATLHQPLTADTTWSRHAEPSLNLIASEKIQRIAAMEEVKRALESAEMIPITRCVLHLGMSNERWSDRKLEYALTAIEHLKAFAAPLGIKLLLENLRSEMTTPENLMEILRIGHFDKVGVCLDVGHAHIAQEGVVASFETLKTRIGEVHLHDNQGKRDEHLWPPAESGTATGTIAWATVYPLLARLPADVPGVLEIGYELNETVESVPRIAAQAFAQQRRVIEKASLSLK
jgi:sugar phosphate isomerase/epimerase